MGGEAGHQRRRRRGSRSRSTRSWLASVSGGSAARPPRPRRCRRRARRGGLTVRDAVEAGAPRRDVAAPRRVRAARPRAVIGVSRKGGNSAAQGVVDLARARRLRQHLGVDRGELDRLKNGIPSAISSAALATAIRPGTAHHELREPVPEALGRRARVALGAAVQERGGERVDPLAEQGEDRRQDDQRDRRRDQRDQRAAEPHRVEEALREDEQRGERAGDGQRAEQHRAAGGRHRPAHRLEARARCGRSPRGSARR